MTTSDTANRIGDSVVGMSRLLQCYMESSHPVQARIGGLQQNRAITDDSFLSSFLALRPDEIQRQIIQRAFAWELEKYTPTTIGLDFVSTIPCPDGFKPLRDTSR